jgi:hypothetical protein
MGKLNVVVPAVNVTVDGIEYRKVDRKAQAGDIVRIKDAQGTVPVNELGEVADYEDNDSFRVNTALHKIGNWHGAETVELVTPVEQRFDR